MAEPSSIFNQDIAWLITKFDRFIMELNKSQSSGVSGMVDADVGRLRSYIGSLRAAHTWVQAQPILDLPETHPRPFSVPDMPTISEFENDSLVHVVRMLEALRIEMANSQSARMPSRLQPFDSARFVAVVDKVERFLEDYIAAVTPLDLPESSPKNAMTGEGRRGV